MSTYEQVAQNIIKEQETIIGPLAFDQARRVEGIAIDNAGHISITGDGKIVLDHLVRQYSELFGKASILVCKEAAKAVNPTVSTEDLPEILK